MSAALPAASILIVDDYPANIMALEAVLRPLGHAVVRAESGEEALKALLQQEFALIIMDVQMPGMDGFQTASMIKMRDRSRHIPIIFLTAISRDAAHIFEGYAHGAVDYLLKPFDPRILRSKVSVFVDLWQRGELLKQREAKLRELEIERVQRQSAARYEALIEAMPQIVLAMRPNGALYYCNSVWQRYSGLDVARTTARGAELVHPDERAAACAAWLEALRERQPLQRELRVRRARDGAYRWHLLHVLPQLDADGALTGFIAAATDIHDEKEARHEVERASRAKDEFLATVSHELRNPLNAILGWTRMLRAGKLDAARAARALETVERNAVMQAALVEDMLDVSRIITGKLMLKVGAVDLPTVIAAALDTVRMAADAKQITVAVELDDELELAAGDPERLQQVVWNLLSNAIKFTPRGGTVTVRTRRAGAHVELTVQDDGQGMPADFLPYVFDRFRQADSTSTRVHGGLGLGLAIVRHLVELHGGTVSVASEGAGRGSTFTVRLPLREAAEAAGDAAAGPRSDGVRSDGALGDATQIDGVRVLVVDDEPDARELLTAILEHHGATVTATGSADGAGRGSTFTVRLPLREAVEPAGDAAAEPRSDGVRSDGALGEATQIDGLTVLVVDDEPDARELLTAILEHHGATVTATGSADEALAAVAERAPDVVVSDIGMPGADGYELMRRLRALPDPARRATPAVALTGFARPEDGARALEAGFAAHLAKPVEPLALVVMIDKVARATTASDADAQPSADAEAQPANSPSTTCFAIG